MPRTVVHDETANELRVGVGLVLHLHDLDHVQIDRVDAARLLGRGLDGEHGVDNVRGELGRELGVELGAERRVRNVDERCAVEGWGLLEFVEELGVS